MKILRGDCLEVLKSLESNSAHSLVTDPPAGISFMGKDWDGDRGGRDEWISWMDGVMRECLRVMKPGAHGLVWALPRTSHWTATALENAGFEVRDVVTHLFGTGFPKSMDISKAIDKAAGAQREVLSTRDQTNLKGGSYGTSQGKTKVSVTEAATKDGKQWAGWGTALKPASEHWILVRKPCSEKTVAANVLKWFVGGINIDASRTEANGPRRMCGTSEKSGQTSYTTGARTETHVSQGRFPANLVLDEEAAAALDAQSGTLKSGDLKKDQYNNGKKNNVYGKYGGFEMPERKGDAGGASRFFYVAKAAKSDKGDDNPHPTVKSTALMSYLIKLVTPPNGVVLDPFMGSGSTGVAAKSNGFGFIGIEREDAYYDYAAVRIELTPSRLI